MRRPCPARSCRRSSLRPRPRHRASRPNVPSSSPSPAPASAEALPPASTPDLIGTRALRRRGSRPHASRSVSMRIRSSITLALGLAALSAAAQAAPQNNGNAFNPGIGLVLNGVWSSYPTAAGNRRIPGFLLGDSAGVGAPSQQGFSLGESELDLSSNFDNLFTGFGAISFHENHGEDSVEVELAYLQTIAMPAGFQVTARKFFSDFGYQNSRHAHVWDFVDQPLVYEAMLNDQYSDPGVQVTWLAPTDTYLMFGSEAFSGDNFPA